MKLTSAIIAVLAATFASTDASALPSSPVSNLESRNYKGVGCDGISVNIDDYLAAKQLFESGCQNQGSTYTVTYGSVAMFFCVWQPGPVCSTDSFLHMVQMVEDQCGESVDPNTGFYTNGVAGSYTDGPDKSKTYSYGITDLTLHSYCNFGAGTNVTTGGPASTSPVYVPSATVGPTSSALPDSGFGNADY